MKEQNSFIKSKEALAWAAGFFYNKGNITITYKSSFIGIVAVRHRDREILNLVREIAAVHGIEISEPCYNIGTGTSHLSFNASKGSELLQLLMAYPMNEKHKRRVEIYLRMHPPGEWRIPRRGERKEIYAEWLRLRVAEGEERNVRLEKKGGRKVGRPRKDFLDRPVSRPVGRPPKVVRDQMDAEANCDQQQTDDDQWFLEYEERNR